MRTLLASIVDTKALLKVIWVSLAAGIGVTGAYSLAVLGLARGRDAQRRGRTGAAVPFFVLTALALAACAWALYRGYLFVVSKG
jgi:hypothetical protein